VRIVGRYELRMTPWVGVALGALLILLTAAGCGSPPKQGNLDAFLTPPLEETAGQDAPVRTTDAARAGADSSPAVAAEVKPRQTVVATPAAPRRVVWTTDQLGASPAPAAAPLEPVVHMTAALPADHPDGPAPPQAALPDTDAAAVGDDDPARPEPMFFVFGEVAQPGPYKHTGRNRVLDIVAQVQPTRAADPSRVMLIRPSLPDGQRVLTIDVDRMVRQGDVARNVVIDAGDILYIPASTPASIGHAFGAFFAPKRETEAPAR